MVRAQVTLTGRVSIENPIPSRLHTFQRTRSSRNKGELLSHFRDEIIAQGDTLTKEGHDEASPHFRWH